MDLEHIALIITAVLGAGGLSALFTALAQARKGRLDRAEFVEKLRSMAIEEWRKLAEERAAELVPLRQRLAQVEILADQREREVIALRDRMAGIEKCLEQTRAELREAQAQVAVLEAERAELRTEREQLLERIRVLEGRRPRKPAGEPARG